MVQYLCVFVRAHSHVVSVSDVPSFFVLATGVYN